MLRGLFRSENVFGYALASFLHIRDPIQQVSVLDFKLVKKGQGMKAYPMNGSKERDNHGAVPEL